MLDIAFLFSIAIPAYKSIYLAKAIQSCLNQTYDNFELIIVDDASPNDIAAIVRQFTDKRIRYYRNDVGFGAEHVVDNWNLCLQYATGKYMICMGDDDELESICLEEYLKLIHKHPNLNIYHARSVIIDENSDIKQLQEDRPEFESVYSMMWHRWFKDRKQFVGDWLFDTVALRQNGGFYNLPYAWHSDDITGYISAKEHGVANTRKPCFRYRENNFSITRNRYALPGKLKAHRMAYSWYVDFLKQKPSDKLDMMYWQDLKVGLESHFSRMVSLEIGVAYRGHFAELVFSGRNIASHCKVSRKELSRAYYYVIKWWIAGKISGLLA